MASPQRNEDRLLTVAEFMDADRDAFGSAWRYELLDGHVVAHAAPVPDHGAIVVNIALAVAPRLARGSGCRAESATAAIPRGKSNATARIPDLVIRCAGLPRVMFEIVSPSELRNQRARNRKRRELQDVDGAEEIVEVYLHDYACHIYRRPTQGAEWTFEAVDGPDAVLALRSVGVEVTLAEMYAGVLSEDAEQDQA